MRCLVILTVMVSCVLLVGCDKVLKSSVNRDLVDAKIQGREILTELKYFKLNKKIFPAHINDIKHSFEYRENFQIEILDNWVYVALEEGANCLLIRNAIIDGYFVFLDKSGNISVSEKLPSADELIYKGP